MSFTMRIKINTTLLLVTASLTLSVNAVELDQFTGLWITDSGNAHISIVDCGNQTPCGSISWI